ncbi:MAG: DUF4143 domain-containing protein [Candidatus Binatia bacterium]
MRPPCSYFAESGAEAQVGTLRNRPAACKSAHKSQICSTPLTRALIDDSIDNTHHRAGAPIGGALMETAVVTEVVRTLTHRGAEPQVFFWRTSTGVEVDLVVDTRRELVPIEAKLSATPNRGMAKGIEEFSAALGQRVAKGYVVHPGDTKLPLGPAAVAWPLGAF